MVMSTLRLFATWSLMTAMLALGTAHAWDGEWTRAKSGEYPAYDPGDKTGNAGTDERPQTFYIPPAREFDNVDPEELYRSVSDYSPHAMAQFTRNVSVGGKPLNKGYYLVRLGQANDGSPRTNQGAFVPVSYEERKERKKADKDAGFDLFVIYRVGTVAAVCPIQERQAYVKQKGDKLPKNPVAWIELENDQPVLKFYYKKTIYTSRL